MLWSPILHRRGCPIRRSTDIVLIYSSPWLIAVSRVLRRLLMPRHSPYALLCLNFFCFSSYLLLWVSQIIFVLQWKSFFRCFLWSSAISDGLIVVFYPILFRKTWFKILKKLSVRFNISLFGFQWSFTFQQTLRSAVGGLKWTRTTDLVLIRHAL